MKAILILITTIVAASVTLQCEPANAQEKSTSQLAFPKPVLKPGLWHPPAPAFEDYRKTYCDALTAELYSNWQPVDPCDQKIFKIHFFIEADGRFYDISVMHPGKNLEAEAACVEAVKKSSEFRKTIPSGVHEVEFTLDRTKKLSTAPSPDCPQQRH